MIDQGAPESDINAYVESEGVTPEELRGEKPDTFSNVAQQTIKNVESTGRERQRLDSMRASGEITPAESSYRKAGQVMKGLGYLGAGAMGAGDLALGRIPSFLAQGAAGLIGQLPVAGKAENLGQYTQAAAKDVAQGYQGLEEKFPRAMGMVGAAGNFASVLTAPVTKKPIESVGSAIIDAGEKQALNKTIELVRAPNTVKNLQKPAAQDRIKESIFSSKNIKPKIAPSDIETRAANLIQEMPEMRGLKGVLPKTDARKKAIIKKNAYKIVDELDSSLGKYNNYKIKPQYIEENLYGKLKKDMLVLDELATAEGKELKAQYETMLNIMKKQIANQPPTAQGLLRARQGFDQRMTDLNANLGIDATGVRNNAAKKMRAELNDFISNMIPDEQVKERLKDASSLLEASRNIQDKIVANANNVLNKDTKASNRLRNLTAGIIGTGAAGAAVVAPGAATAAIPFALTASGIYVGGKVLNTSLSKKAIGKFLQLNADTIDVGTKSILQDYMEELQNQDEETLKMPAKDVIKSNEGKR